MNPIRMFPPILFHAVLGVAVISTGAGTSALAGTIVWGSPQTISGDSDVSTTGSLVYAYNVGTTTVVSSTVNGVTFSAFPFPLGGSGTTVTVGTVTMTESPDFLVSYNSLGSSSSPYSSLSSAYKTLLNSGGSAGSPATITMDFGGLSVGAQYIFQWWASNAANIPPVSQVNASATNDVTLDSNLTNSTGGVGQYVIGTFTADSTTQSIALTGVGGQPLINAFQMRAVVPEPSTYAMALAGLACGGFSMWRRRKRA